MNDEIQKIADEYGPSLALIPLGVQIGIGVIVIGLTVWANWRIVSRAGYAGVWSLLMFVPIANVFFLLWFAWRRWPIQGPKSRRT